MTPDDILKLKGWEFLDSEKVRASRGKAAANAHALDVLAYDTFSTTAGKKLLRWMVQQTILRPTVTGAASQFQAGIREGQNDLVRQILAMIERSQKGPQP